MDSSVGQISSSYRSPDVGMHTASNTTSPYFFRVKQEPPEIRPTPNAISIKTEPVWSSEEAQPGTVKSEPGAKKAPRKKGSKTKQNEAEPPGPLAKKKMKQEKITDLFPEKKRRKVDRFNGMPEEEVLLKILPDHLDYNLDIVIVGINPGLFAAYKGHHYAGPGNHFWKCMYLSGLIPEQMNAMDDYKLVKYGIGFTNIVARTSRGSADLTRKEVKEGAGILLKKIQKYNPKIACFNGKGIYEIFCGKKDFQLGIQPDSLDETSTAVYVMPSSSARCSQLPRAVDKVPFYLKLKEFRDQLKGIKTSELSPYEKQNMGMVNLSSMPDLKAITKSYKKTPEKKKGGSEAKPPKPPRKSSGVKAKGQRPPVHVKLEAQAEGEIPEESLPFLNEAGSTNWIKQEPPMSDEAMANPQQQQQQVLVKQEFPPAFVNARPTNLQQQHQQQQHLQQQQVPIASSAQWHYPNFNPGAAPTPVFNQQQAASGTPGGFAGAGQGAPPVPPGFIKREPVDYLNSVPTPGFHGNAPPQPPAAANSGLWGGSEQGEESGGGGVHGYCYPPGCYSGAPAQKQVMTPDPLAQCMLGAAGQGGLVLGDDILNGSFMDHIPSLNENPPWMWQQPK